MCKIQNRLFSLIKDNLPLIEVEAYRGTVSGSKEFKAGEYLVDISYELQIDMQASEGDYENPPAEMVDGVECVITDIEVWADNERTVAVSDSIKTLIEVLIIKNVHLL